MEVREVVENFLLKILRLLPLLLALRLLPYIPLQSPPPPLTTTTARHYVHHHTCQVSTHLVVAHATRREIDRTGNSIAFGCFPGDIPADADDTDDMFDIDIAKDVCSVTKPCPPAQSCRVLEQVGYICRCPAGFVGVNCTTGKCSDRGSTLLHELSHGHLQLEARYFAVA